MISHGCSHPVGYFSECQNGQIGRITPAGKIIQFPLPNPKSDPGDITAGPDGNPLVHRKHLQNRPVRYL